MQRKWLQISLLIACSLLSTPGKAGPYTTCVLEKFKLGHGIRVHKPKEVYHEAPAYKEPYAYYEKTGTERNVFGDTRNVTTQRMGYVDRPSRRLPSTYVCSDCGEKCCKSPYAQAPQLQLTERKPKSKYDRASWIVRINERCCSWGVGPCGRKDVAQAPVDPDHPTKAECWSELMSGKYHHATRDWERYVKSLWDAAVDADHALSKRVPDPFPRAKNDLVVNGAVGCCCVM